MNPGPATSMDSNSWNTASASVSISASSRGFLPAFLAATMAKLQAKSPCSRFFGSAISMVASRTSAGRAPEVIRDSIAYRNSSAR